MFHLGDFRVAISEFEQAIVGFENISHIEQVNLLGADFSVFTLSYLSHAWWCVGRVEEAVNTNRKALDLARQIGHAFSIALAHAYAAMLYVLLDDLVVAHPLGGDAILRAGQLVLEPHEVLARRVLANLAPTSRPIFARSQRFLQG